MAACLRIRWSESVVNHLAVKSQSTLTVKTGFGCAQPYPDSTFWLAFLILSAMFRSYYVVQRRVLYFSEAKGSRRERGALGTCRNRSPKATPEKFHALEPGMIKAPLHGATWPRPFALVFSRQRQRHQRATTRVAVKGTRPLKETKTSASASASVSASPCDENEMPVKMRRVGFSATATLLLRALAWPCREKGIRALELD